MTRIGSRIGLDQLHEGRADKTATCGGQARGVAVR
jgi:hypothetical protein